ncbi:MAG: Na+/H+ antiporter NhaA [Myxococcales bacterium]|nr:Na+/H+ antiporter NhaA [Myxococcales bacterium]
MHSSQHPHPTPPPGSSARAHQLASRARAALARLTHRETFAGVLLMVAAAAALLWANSPWAKSYTHLLHSKLTLGFGAAKSEVTLHFLVNEVLMTIFFLVVGLEVKRELVVGELRDLRRAALPVAAALGGMIAPALVFAAINAGKPGLSGWGVPMATDIAFAVGVLALLGRGLPPSLRALLLALAIIDDIGAVIVIAVFYSSSLSAAGVPWIAVGLLVLFAFRRAGVRPGFVYLVPLALLWHGLHSTGIHPTLAGVIVGLSAPARAWLDGQAAVAMARGALDELSRCAGEHGDDEHALVEPLRRVRFAEREALSPTVRGPANLHPWVAFVILPLFALANAGVSLAGVDFAPVGASAVSLGVALGLVLGKPLGIVALSLLAVRLRLCRLPDGVDFRGLCVVGLLGGVGFTMAIFIAELAFSSAASIALAKVGVLGGSAVAGVLAVIFGGALARARRRADSASGAGNAALGEVTSA